jgi:SAM-dependent methyltransferase
MIFKISDLVEGYRLKALHSRDVHELAGRRDRIDITRFTGNRVSSELALGPEDDLVDIGCGDGYLIRTAKVRSVLGLTATKEEAERLQSLGLDVRQGLTHALPIADAAASAVSCNGVLFLAPPDKIEASLAEMARITRPGGRVWIGEMPKEAENTDSPVYTSVIKLLWFLLRHRGLRTFLGMCKIIALTTWRREPFIMNTGPSIRFYAQPVAFREQAAKVGLKLQKCCTSRTLDPEGHARDLSTRMDYLFVRT